MLLAVGASTALAADPRFEPEVEPCSNERAKLEPPPGWVYVEGTAESRARAWSQAKAEAVAQFAPNGSLSRREAVARAVRPWCIRTDTRGLGREYSYLALVKKDVAEAHERELSELDRQWARLVGALADGVEGASLWIAPVVWKTGCASDLGAYIEATLGLEAGVHGLPALLAAGPAEANAILHLELSLVDGQVIVVPTLEASAGRRTLPGLQFAADLFHLESAPQDRCPTNARIALAADRKEGRDGLRVFLEGPVAGGVACAGDRGGLTVTTNRKAAVRIYNLDREGRGYVVYDTPAFEGRVDLGVADLIPTDDGGDERIVAVAWPAGSEPAPTGGACRLPGGFSDVVLPEGVAVDTTTWIVRPPGVEACPQFDVARVREKLPGRVCR